MFIGIDVGGTGIKAGVVAKNGEILVEKSCPTLPKRDPRIVVDDLIYLIHEVINESKVNKDSIEGIGIGIPGIADPINGDVIECVNLYWRNIPLKEWILEEFDMPIYIDNDASVAALAEFETGSLKGTNNSVLLTLGTGIGAGIIINGKLHSGTHGVTEFGHTIVGENFYDCTCNRNGCLETFASATALIKYTKKIINESKEHTIILDKVENDLDKLDAKTIVDAAKEGDKLANRALDRLIKYLKIGLANIIYTIDPELIALGGGLSKAGNFLIDRLTKEVNNFKLFDDVDIAKIVLAKLGNEAGIIGAAMLCKNK